MIILRVHIMDKTWIIMQKRCSEPPIYPKLLARGPQIVACVGTCIDGYTYISIRTLVKSKVIIVCHYHDKSICNRSRQITQKHPSEPPLHPPLLLLLALSFVLLSHDFINFLLLFPEFLVVFLLRFLVFIFLLRLSRLILVYIVDWGGWKCRLNFITPILAIVTLLEVSQVAMLCLFRGEIRSLLSIFIRELRVRVVHISVRFI